MYTTLLIKEQDISDRYISKLSCNTTYVSSFNTLLKGSMFGYLLAVIDNTVLIGSPFDRINQGSITMFSNNDSAYIYSDDFDNSDSRFESSVTFIDINRDRQLDIVVGEPGYYDNRGRLHLFLHTNDANHIIINNMGNPNGLGKVLTLTTGDL